MGMDVYGNSGNYFRRNVWGWRPLWDVVETFVPKMAAKVTHAYSNDGDGLNGEDSVLLALMLMDAVRDGSVDKYIKDVNEQLDRLPLETCETCKGTGTRDDEVGQKLGYAARNWCNGCDGKGQVKNFLTNYETDTDSVIEFATFLFNCEGFEIC